MWLFFYYRWCNASYWGIDDNHDHLAIGIPLSLLFRYLPCNYKGMSLDSWIVSIVTNNWLVNYNQLNLKPKLHTIHNEQAHSVLIVYIVKIGYALIISVSTVISRIPKLSNYYNKRYIYIIPIPPTQRRGEGYPASVTLTYSALSRMDLLFWFLSCIALCHPSSFTFYRGFTGFAPFLSPRLHCLPLGSWSFPESYHPSVFLPFLPLSILSLKVFGFVNMVYYFISHTFIVSSHYYIHYHLCLFYQCLPYGFTGCFSGFGSWSSSCLLFSFTFTHVILLILCHTYLISCVVQSS